jgi:hypothetical protein
MERAHVDAFQVFGGALAVLTAPLMLATGEPAGWSFLLLAAGIVVLGAFAVIVFEIDYDIHGPRHLAVFVVAGLCLAVAVIYLTRAANDLPRLFPGYDGDSEQFRILPGLLALAAGSVVMGGAIAQARPRRARDDRR